MPGRKYVIARDAFDAEINGETVSVKAGEIFAEDHPLVRAYPEQFAGLKRARPRVEQMTAAPGERRGDGSSV
jgi:hypothetical protein